MKIESSFRMKLFFLLYEFEIFQRSFKERENSFFFNSGFFFVIINDIELGSQVKFGRRHSATTAPVGLPGLPGFFFLSDWNVIISNDYKTEPQTKIRTVEKAFIILRIHFFATNI